MANLNLRNVSRAASSQHPIRSVDVGGNRLTEFGGSGREAERLFHVALFMNEDEVPACLMSGEALCLNQRTQWWDDMFGFSQQLNRSALRGMDSRNSPCHQRSEWGVTLTGVNAL